MNIRILKSVRKLGAVLLSTLIISPTAGATAFPDKSLQIVVPYRPGGTPDLLTRMVAEKLTSLYGKAVVVHNKTGASGVIAVQELMNQPADGYTMLLADNGLLAINPKLNKSLRYDPIKDFQPVTQIVNQPFSMFSHKDVGVKTLKQLIEKAKVEPGTLNYASVGNGTPHHLCMSMFTNMADIKLTHVPFRSISDVAASMIAGDVQLVCTSSVGVKPLMDRGAGVELAINATERSPFAPDTLTFSESSGLEPLLVGATIGILVKAGTPEDIVNQLSADIKRVLADPELKAQIEELGMTIVADGPQAYARTISEELERYGEMVKISGATVE